MIKKIGDLFQKMTKYNRGKMFEGYLDWSNKPEIYKSYRENKKFLLPSTANINTASFNESIKKRKSTRKFTAKNLTLKELSYLLWSSTGIQRRKNGYEFRTTPSAGALYPIETYLSVDKVDTIDKGLYHYNVKAHLLEELKVGSFSNILANACLGQQFISTAAIVLVWSAIFNRSKWKYKQRAYRYVYLDCGHIAQTIALSASSLGLASCQVGAFYDDELNDIFELDGKEESVIYLSVVGYPE